MTAPGALPRVVPFGEAALLLVLGDAMSEALRRRVGLLEKLVLDQGRGQGVAIERPVPGHASLLVPFDPLRTSAAELRPILEGIAAEVVEVSLPPEPEVPAIVVPVHYGGPDGPDLDEVAERVGLSPDRVVELHAGVDYRVFLLGFAPGFAYLGILPPELELPRRPEPRVRVPPGSVAIAGRQTAVYPHATAGGWHLLGRTGLAFWVATADPPARLRNGDRVRFVPA